MVASYSSNNDALVMGIIFTDCYLAYKSNELKYHRNVLPYDEFLGKLAYQLIFNIYFDEQRDEETDNDEVIIIVMYMYYHI